MRFDLSDQPESVQQAAGHSRPGEEIARDWLMSPDAGLPLGVLAAKEVEVTIFNVALQRPTDARAT